MRYIIIPLGIVLYIFLWYKAIKNINKPAYSNARISAFIWIAIHILPIAAFIGATIVHFCIENW